MAIDDVVSDYTTSLSNNARLSLQPASGDEWLVTHVFVKDPHELNPTSSTNTILLGPLGTNTALTADWSLGGAGQFPLAMLVTNSDYFRIKNVSGSTRNAGFSAIKTKD